MTDPTATAYAAFVLALGSGDISFAADTFHVALCTSAYVPDIDAHTFLSDLTDEATGTGYTAGGVALTGVTWTIVTDTSVTPNVRRGVMAADTVTFSSITVTGVRYAVIYQYTGTSTTSRLVGYIDLIDPRTFSAEDYQISFSSGVVRIKF